MQLRKLTLTLNLNENLILFIVQTMLSLTLSLVKFSLLFQNDNWIITRLLSLKNHFDMINSSSILLKLSIVFSISLRGKSAYENRSDSVDFKPKM